MSAGAADADAARRAAFERDGFLQLDGFAAPAACDALVARAGEIVAAFDPAAGAGVFSTRDQRHAADDWFRSSGDKVRCFLEEEAVDADGRLVVDKQVAVNKIGHALHDLEPLFSGFCRMPRLAGLTRSLGVAEPLLLQSMVIFKSPRLGGEVTCHQDGSFLLTEPESVLGFWFALADATPDNGCLHVLPGAHRAPLRQRFRRDGDTLQLEVLDPRPWPVEDAVPLPAHKGDLIVLHGRLPHFSAANRSTRPRPAFTLHVIDGACRYLEDNWLQRGADMPLRGFDGKERPGR